MTEPHVAVLSQVQQFLDRQHGLYIDGRPGPAQSEKRLAIFDPATGQEIASTADANEADVDNAVMSAWRAFVSRRWAGRLCHQLRHRIKSMVGISTDVMIVNCGSIPRSEGKACRVFDLRNIVGA